MKTNEAGVSLIKQFEGLVDGDPKTPGIDPYICPTGYVTIGYGHVLKDEQGKMLRGKDGLATAKRLHKAISSEEADALLHEDLKIYEAAVLRQTNGIALNENQFSALVSFVFNFGETKFRNSTMLRHLLDGNFDKAANEFPKWVKGDTNGDGVLETLPGLVRRREAERQLFLKEVKPLAKSRTVWASIATIATTGAAAATDAAQQVQIAQGAVAATGTELDIFKYILAACAVLAAAFTIYVRIDDRVRKGH